MSLKSMTLSQNKYESRKFMRTIILHPKAVRPEPVSWVYNAANSKPGVLRTNMPNAGGFV